MFFFLEKEPKTILEKLQHNRVSVEDMKREMAKELEFIDSQFEELRRFHDFAKNQWKAHAVTSIHGIYEARAAYTAELEAQREKKLREAAGIDKTPLEIFYSKFDCPFYHPYYFQTEWTLIMNQGFKYLPKTPYIDLEDMPGYPPRDPTSPVYSPTSPTYCPTSPTYDLISHEEEESFGEPSLSDREDEEYIGSLDSPADGDVRSLMRRTPPLREGKKSGLFLLDNGDVVRRDNMGNEEVIQILPSSESDSDSDSGSGSGSESESEFRREHEKKPRASPEPELRHEVEPDYTPDYGVDGAYESYSPGQSPQLDKWIYSPMPSKSPSPVREEEGEKVKSRYDIIREVKEEWTKGYLIHTMTQDFYSKQNRWSFLDLVNFGLTCKGAYLLFSKYWWERFRFSIQKFDTAKGFGSYIRATARINLSEAQEPENPKRAFFMGGKSLKCIFFLFFF